MLKNEEVQAKCNEINFSIWAAADYDQLGTEMVFSNLLKGQLPDPDGFQKLKDLKDQEIG